MGRCVFRRLEVGEVCVVKPSEKLYRFHVKNLRAVSDGLEHVFRSARNAVARGAQNEVGTYVRLLSFLLGAWSEVRLLKLLYEPNGFSETDRRHILKENALGRWLLVVSLAFRTHYKIPKAELCPPQLPSTAHHRLRTLIQALENELSDIITMRNKLAHGQWRYPLNDEMDEVAQPQMDALREENVLSLKHKWLLLEDLCQAVHDLVISLPTFQRDWDSHFRQVEQMRTNLRRKSYKKWEAQLIAKHR